MREAITETAENIKRRAVALWRWLKRFWRQAIIGTATIGIVAAGGVTATPMSDTAIHEKQQAFFEENGYYLQILPDNRLPSDTHKTAQRFKKETPASVRNAFGLRELPEQKAVDVHEHPDGKWSYTIRDTGPPETEATSTARTLWEGSLFAWLVEEVRANTHSADFEADNNEYGSITDANQTGLDLTTDFTIEGWAKFETLGASMMIAKAESGCNTGDPYCFGLAGGNQLLINFADGSNVTQVTADSAIGAGTGTWTHIAVTCDISVPDCKLYEDGTEVASTANLSDATTITDSGDTVFMGRRENGGSPEAEWDGRMDQVRVWDDIRTPTEISDNMCEEVSASAGNLVAYWKLDNDLTDETTNNNDLTNNNTVTFTTETALDTSPLCAVETDFSPIIFD